MKRIAWPHLAPKVREPRVDPAPAKLSQAGSAIAARVAGVFRELASASCTEPTRGSLRVAAEPHARVWSSDIGDGLDLWCTLDLNATRALLAIVLGGPAAPTPTALERGIIRETIDRLLLGSDRIWEECAAALVPSAEGWLCSVNIASKRGTSGAELCLFAPAAAEPPVPVMACVDIRNVPLCVEASLPAISVRVSSIEDWRRGTIVPLDCEDTPVELSACGVTIATGTLGAFRAKRAVRVDRCAARTPC